MPTNVGLTRTADSFAFFREAVNASYGDYTSYSYIEGDGEWFVFTQLVPGFLLLYTIEKGSAEETVFDGDKTAVDAYAPKERVDWMMPHTLGGDNHIDDTLADLNNKVNDAWLLSSKAAEIDSLDAKAVPVVADLLLIEDSEDANAKKKVPLSNLPGVLCGFGGEFQYEEDEAEDYTTEKVLYTQKLRLTTPTLDGGDYMIKWFCEVANSNKDRGTFVKVEIDDTTVLCDSTKGKVNQTMQYSPMDGWAKKTLTAAAHNIDLDYRPEDYTGYIRRARLAIWKVGE